MSKALSKTVGETIEELVFDAVDELQPAAVPESFTRAPDDYWHDAQLRVALFHSEQVPMVGICVIEDDVPVEIKAACATISDGTESRNGRFQIHRPQHEQLLDAGGVYLFALYSEGVDGEELLGLLAVPAVIIEEELRSTWYEVDGRDDYWQLSASRLPIDGLGGEADA
jgi:hypothetical protein